MEHWYLREGKLGLRNTDFRHKLSHLLLHVCTPTGCMTASQPVLSIIPNQGPLGVRWGKFLVFVVTPV